MSHPRGVVFAGAFGSLLVMSVLSAALGHTVPHLSICLLRELTDR
jgi:Ca2+/H+ antiporter, TMEM165/GDT1 family